MRTIVFTFLASFITTVAAAGQPIISMQKIDGGKRGYYFVSAEMGISPGGTEGWVVNCIDPGRTQCRPPMGSTAPEGVDTDVFEESIRLVEYADNEWDQGFTSGSYVTEFHSLQGEKSLKVEWEVVDRIRYITVSLEE